MSTIARTDRSLVGTWWWTVDHALLGAIALLAAIGVIMVLASSPPIARKLELPETYFVIKHVVFLGPAALVLVVASLLAPLGVLRVAKAVLAIGLPLLALTLLIGPEVKGARRWLPVAGVLLQPSEFVKPVLVVVVGWLLAIRGPLAGFAPAAGLVAVVVGLLFLQPDMGMGVLVVAVFGAQLLLAGTPWPLLALLGFGGLGLLWVGYLLLPHVQARIDAFLDPAAEPYQVQAALEAIASGGWFGRGPGEGVVKFYLPEAHSDFVFATMAEEFGILACLVVVALFAFIVLRGFARLAESPDRFVLVAGGGLLTQLGLQAFINMGVNLELLPTKGMTLPFVSYGGSSLLALALGTGLMLALMRRGARLEEP